MRRRRSWPRRDERGAVTAEAAMVIPLLLAVTVGLAWLLTLGVTKVRVVDAARETARAAAREEDRAVAVGLGRRAAPEGASVSVRRGQEEVTATVSSTVRGPGGLFGAFPGVEVRAEAVAALEDP